jgi:hypothetical protein
MSRWAMVLGKLLGSNFFHRLAFVQQLQRLLTPCL